MCDRPSASLHAGRGATFVEVAYEWKAGKGKSSSVVTGAAPSRLYRAFQPPHKSLVSRVTTPTGGREPRAAATNERGSLAISELAERFGKLGYDCVARAGEEVAAGEGFRRGAVIIAWLRATVQMRGGGQDK